LLNFSDAEAIQSQVNFLEALAIGLCEYEDVSKESFENLESGGVIGEVDIDFFLEFAACPYRLREISIGVVSGNHYDLLPEYLIELAEQGSKGGFMGAHLLRAEEEMDVFNGKHCRPSLFQLDESVPDEFLGPAYHS